MVELSLNDILEVLKRIEVALNGFTSLIILVLLSYGLYKLYKSDLFKNFIAYLESKKKDKNS